MQWTTELTLERLSSELDCLTVLGALSAEETRALGECIDDLRRMHFRIAAGDTRFLADGLEHETDRSEFLGLARALAADLDLAFRRLTVSLKE
jgi:hypothetical protein